MEALGLIILIAGWVIVIVADLWLLVVAIQESVLWFVALFFPIVWLIFVVLHWHEAKRPFLLGLLGALLILAGNRL